MISFDSNLLLGYFQARNGTAVGGSVLGSTAGAKKAPTPPWSTLSKAPKVDEIVGNVLRGRKFVDEDLAKLDVKGASEDYKKLFAMHQALATLESLAKRADSKDTSTAELKRIQTAFDRGMAEVSAYIDAAKFEKLRLTHGDAADKAKMAVGVPKTSPRYVTAVLHEGSETDEVEAFKGDIRFQVSVKQPNNVTGVVDFDLSEMGSTPRTMANVVKYMNDKLAQTSYTTRFAVERTKGEDKTAQINGRTVTLAKGKDQFALKIQGDSTEKLTFSAPVTSPAVYVTQKAGDPNPDGKVSTDDGVFQQELLKFETGTTADAVRRPGDTNWVEGRVFGGALPESVKSVRTQVMGSDGFIYMLADVDGAIDGQEIKGSTDVALLKLDSAGNIVYTRTLGASENASGLALSVADDGRVAIAGSVTGGLDATDKFASASVSDSFVTVFNSKGEELWTERRGASAEDEATGVAFGADGSVHVLGRTRSAMPGAAGLGGWDNYLLTYSDAGTLRSTLQFGTAGEDKPAGLVVDGSSVVVASIEGGEINLRRFDMSDPFAPTLQATRNLGSLGGGNVAGIAIEGGNIILAGSTGPNLSVGTTTRAASGGVDAFALRVSAGLSAGASDAIAYYGGAGDDRATAMTIAGGKVWLTGTSKTDLPGMTEAVGKADGFIAELDLDTGAVGWSQRFTGQDKFGAPNSISVDMTGASALDRLGLPKGYVDYTDSQLVTSGTAARAGDQFQIRVRPGARPVTITIEANDTLDTLAQKVRRATGFQVRVDLPSDGERRMLQIRPQNSRQSLEILGGKGGRDALEALGLKEGFVRTTTFKDGKSVPADGGNPMYGLKLPRDLHLNSPEAIKAAIDRLTMATSTLRTAYRDLQAGLNPQSTAKKATGEAPAYLKAQIANYQAGLNRLLGG
ncbi:MAG: hypothetical protein ACK41C_14170 [Phenylobacterium sp.]|uniref:hypothetical protein n=1 Tax=Phenylobacterium sp. TaxID=1871053 RepID=UPI00391D2E6B